VGRPVKLITAILTL